MMSQSADLLTPSESNAFSSFLSAMDSFDPSNSSFPASSAGALGLSAEWNMYNHHRTSSNGSSAGGYGQHSNGKEELARATMDLIGSGNGVGYGAQRTGLMLMGNGNGNGTLVRPSQMSMQYMGHQQRQSTHPPSNLPVSAMMRSNSGGMPIHPPYPQDATLSNPLWPSIPSSGSASGTSSSGVHLKLDSAQQYGTGSSPSVPALPHGGSMGLTRPSLASLSTSFPQGSRHVGSSSSSSSTSSAATPRSLATPTLESPTSAARPPPSRKRPSQELNFFDYEATHQPLDTQYRPVQISNKRLRFSPSSVVGGVPLPNESELVLSTSPSVSRKPNSLTARSKSHSSGRTKAASDQTPSTLTPSSSSSSTTTTLTPSSPTQSHPSGSSTTGGKPVQLLTNSQKKLNHIQSEQKRRANIRRGYDSLCDVVPALRDAIIAEDKECERTGKKRGRGRLLGDDGEKLDGRAGPRSESVVLQKTIEYMTELLDTRSTLLDRLAVARGALPPGHLVLSAHQAVEKPWDRVWNGGIGLPVGGLGDGADGEGDDGSDGDWDGEDGE